MNSLKTYIAFLLTAILFTSCQKVIEFNGEITEPIVIVNSLVTPDSVVSAQVSYSRFFLSNDSAYTMIPNAQTNLYVNGSLKETLIYKSNGVYVGTYKPVVGDSLSLLIKVPGEKDVTCGTTQKSAPLVSFSLSDTSTVATGKRTPIFASPTSKDTIGIGYEYKTNCLLHLTDDGVERNYYRLAVTTKTTLGTKKTYVYTFNFDDIVSGNTNNNIGPPTSLVSNKYNIFDNQLFFGKSYALKFSVLYNRNVFFPGHEKNPNKQEVTINLQKISHSYYLYLQTRAGINTRNFFAEPVQVYSNVDGGIGIMGSYTNNEIILSL
ncbi:MAG: DUF4249 domain-containing protein [Paludibacter sp.]